MIKYLKDLFIFIKQNDPSIKNNFELILMPGVKAIIYYRISRYFYLKKHYYIARKILEKCKRKTGIEIHPGATIGKNLFIDHGLGVIIGETSIIKDNVIIYQGVTIGATGKKVIGRRHPIIGNNVFIGSGAKILGNIEIGNNVKIGANAVVLKDIPSNVTTVGIPSKIIKNKKINKNQKNSCQNKNISI